MSKLSSTEFLAACMNNNDDTQVIPYTYRTSGHTTHKTFKRVKSGYCVEIGWSSDYRIGPMEQKPAGMSYDTFFESLDLRIRWLPECRGQDLAAQIRNGNIYYTVDGFAEIAGVVASDHFHTSIHSNSDFGAFLPPDSSIMKEYWRLRAIEDARAKIAQAAEARKTLLKLNVSGPLHAHPEGSVEVNA